MVLVLSQVFIRAEEVLIFIIKGDIFKQTRELCLGNKVFAQVLKLLVPSYGHTTSAKAQITL
jgi:hypothetical protein